MNRRTLPPSVDHSLQATFYRTALLLGLVRGDDVHGWAEAIIAGEPDPPIAVIEVAAVPASDLTEMRHALWPLAINPDPRSVIDAVLGVIQADLASGRRGLTDTLTILRQIRSMVRVPADVYAEINDALIAHAAGARDGAEIAGWLARYRREPGTPPHTYVG